MAGAAAAVERRDRFGLGWRPALAAGILAHLDRIDLIEVIAEDYFDAPRRDLRALQTLAAQVGMVLHGVSLGLASTVPVETRRLDRMARLIAVACATERSIPHSSDRKRSLCVDRPGWTNTAEFCRRASWLE